MIINKIIFKSYKKIINNSIKNNFINDHSDNIKIIKNIVTDFYNNNKNEYEEAQITIDNIKELFDYTSDCILNFMYNYYNKHDIELYFILMKSIENNL